MEVNGTRIMVEKLKSSNIIIKEYVHDNDASTTAVVKKLYPEAKEFHDVLHKVRAIMRNLYASNNKTLKIKEWVRKMMIVVKFTVYNRVKTIEQKKETMKINIVQWSSLLDNCVSLSANQKEAFISLKRCYFKSGVNFQ